MDFILPWRPFSFLKKLFHGLLFFVFNHDITAFAAPAPLIYEGANGQRHPIMITSPLTASGSVMAPTYKGTDGQWHSTTVVMQICGTDSGGKPLACPPVPQNVITATQIGVESGIAGLDSQGAVFEAVNTPGSIAAQTAVTNGLQAAIPLQMTSNGWQGDTFSHLAGPRITMGVPIPNMADNMALFGGHRLYDSVFSKFYALPYGVGDNGGCVHSSVMSLAPGTGANCGAGGWDAVDEYEQASNNPPWYIAGADFPDENGTAHSVVFTANGAIVRPALPASYMAQMHYHMHVMTNIVAGPTIYSGLSLDGVQAHQNQDQQFYGNMLQSWSSGSDSNGSFTQFTMTGQWEPISGPNVDNGHAPAIGTVNIASKGQTDTLDQVEYAEWTHPFIEFGTYIKAFTRNTTCSIVVRNDVDQGTNMKRLGPTRACDEELDNWYHGPDYGATMHGLTIGAGFDNKVSQDSYGLAIGGAWPEGIRSWLGPDGIDFDGDEFKLGSRMGSPATIGAQKMIAEWWQEPTANIGYMESVKLWAQTDSISEQNNGNTHGPAANGQDISYWFGPRQSASSFRVDGQFESAITFNPNWSKNGLGLCGAHAAGYFGTSSQGIACLTVDTWGNTTTTGTLTSGNGLVVNAGDSVLGGALKVSGSLNGQQVVATQYQETLSTPSSSSAPCQAGQFTDDTNYHYVCVATNTWKRVALSSF